LYSSLRVDDLKNWMLQKVSTF